MTQSSQYIHATAIEVSGKGVLLRGKSGSGKSDLALRLTEHEQCRLIADDQVGLERDADTIIMRPPALLAGKLEVRGLGIIDLPYKPHSYLHMIVDLTDRIERMPDLKESQATILGIKVFRIFLNPFEASAPAKIRLAVQNLR